MAPGEISASIAVMAAAKQAEIRSYWLKAIISLA